MNEEPISTANEKANVILVCLSPSPSNARVIHAGAKMINAYTENATALYVCADQHSVESKPLQDNIAIAKEAGFEIHVIESNDITLTIAEYAKRIRATDLFLGDSAPEFGFFRRRPTSTRLLEYLPQADIHIIPDIRASSVPAINRAEHSFSLRVLDILLMISIMTMATLLSVWFDRSQYSNANIITIYILAVLITSLLTSHRIYGILAAVLYILLFNFLFIDPRFTLLVYDPQYMMTYFVTIIAAFLTGSITIRMKTIARRSAENAYQAKVLLDTSNQLERATDRNEIIRITCVQLADLLNRNILFYEGESVTDPHYYSRYRGTLDYAQYRKEADAIAWTVKNRHHAGAFTSHFSNYRCRYYSIYSDSSLYGTIGIDMNETRFTEFEHTILLSILREFAMALENEQISSRRRAAELEAQNERLRAGLLRSISHDLRTPLTTIYGNAWNLSRNEAQFSEAERHKIYTDMTEDSFWLITQMENILSVTKLENNACITLTAENVYDVIREAIRHTEGHTEPISVVIKDVSEDLFAEMDAKLIIQVLVNLIDNAVKYTPPGSVVEISCQREGDLIWILVADNGPGIPDEAKAHIFEPFYTASTSSHDSFRSLGLGLNLCYMILKAHGGIIEVQDNQPHGAVFRFSLKAKEVQSYE